MTGITQVVTSAIIKNTEGKYLIVKRAAHDSFPNTWEFPGGKSDFGEHPETSVAREVLEETGLAIIPLFPAVVNSYVSTRKKNTAYVEIFFISELSIPNQTIQLSEEHSDYAWVDFEDITTYKTTEYIHEVIARVTSLPNLVHS